MPASAGGRDVQHLLEHLAAGLAEQRMVGAGRLHQRIEPRADPVQAADPHAAARLRVAEDHQRRRGDLAEPPRQQLAPIQPLQHVFVEAIGVQERRQVFGGRSRRRRAGGSTSPGRRRPAPGRDRSGGPAGRRPRAPSPRTPSGAAGRGTCRSSPGPSGAGDSSTRSPSAAGTSLHCSWASNSSITTAAAWGFSSSSSASQPRSAAAPSSASRRAASARKPASSTASSGENDWRSLVHRGRLGSPPAGPGVDDRRLQPADFQRAAVQDESVAGDQPLGVRRLQRADGDPVLQHPHRLLRADRADVAAEPSGHAAVADAEPAAAPPDPRRRPSRRRARLGLVRTGRRRELAGQERQAGVEIGPRQPGHRAGLADHVERRVDRLLPRAGHADELLADDVQRRRDAPNRLDPAGPGGPRRDQRRRPARRASPPASSPRDAGTPAMARPAHALQTPRHAARQADLDRHVGRADVHAQLQAGAGHHGADLARLQPRLDRPPPLRIQRRVVRGDHRLVRVLAVRARPRPDPSPGVGEPAGEVLSAPAAVTGSVSEPRLTVPSTARRAMPTVTARRSCVIFSAKARVLAKTTVVRFAVDDLAEASQQPAVAQAAVGRLAGPDQALDGESPTGGVPGGRGASITRQVRDGPTRNRAIASSGRQVADSPTRQGSRPACAATRSSETARSAPRFVGARAWTSSTIRCSTVLPVRLPALLAQEQREALGRGDQDVRRIVPQLAALVGRGVARPHADPDRAGRPAPAGGAMPSSGSARLRSMS